MKKSNDYKSMLASLLVYYYESLINEGNVDPIKTIVTEFTNIIEVNKKQEMFIFNEIDDMDVNIDDYLNEMIKLIQLYKYDPSVVSKEDLEAMERGFKLLKKNLILNNKKGA